MPGLLTREAQAIKEKPDIWSEWSRRRRQNRPRFGFVLAHLDGQGVEPVEFLFRAQEGCSKPNTARAQHRASLI